MEDKHLREEKHVDDKCDNYDGGGCLGGRKFILISIFNMDASHNTDVMMVVRVTLLVESLF
jgi:hypothetical protein